MRNVESIRIETIQKGRFNPLFKKPGLAGKVGGDKGNGSDCIALRGNRRISYKFGEASKLRGIPKAGNRYYVPRIYPPNLPCMFETAKKFIDSI